MQLSISSISRNRRLSGVLDRVRPRLEALQREIAGAVHRREQIIIWLVDEPFGYYYEVPNQHGYYQVDVGHDFDRKDFLLPSGAEADHLLFQISAHLRTAILRCPMQEEERDRMLEILDCWQRDQPVVAVAAMASTD